MDAAGNGTHGGAAGAPVVKFYTTPSCHWCGGVRRALRACRKFVDFEVEEVPPERASPPVRCVPALEFPNEKRLLGQVTRDELLNELFRNLY
ncbi:MAG: hypothetical protein ACTSU5_03110 [Promethearchaeota archaeon]